MQVAVLDSGGHVVTGDNSDTVTLTINKGTLLGTLSQPVVNGVATFPDLSITKADTGYQLTAAVTAIPSVPSNFFNVGPSNATQLSYVVAPATSFSAPRSTPSWRSPPRTSTATSRRATAAAR